MFSCGVSFADDPKQTLGPGFLDELAEVGYEWLELGPYSYLPTGPEPAVRRAGQAGCVKATCQTVYASLQQAGQFDTIPPPTRQVLSRGGIHPVAGGSDALQPHNKRSWNCGRSLRLP
jgi:inosose dehydratase